MNPTQPDKLKIVDNYQLEALIFQSPHCQFWIAAHKILKKSYIMKKIKLADLGVGRSRLQNSAYERALNQANLLKRVNLELKPKFHKIIRTNAHIYSIYDQFQGIPLSKYLQTSASSLKQRLILLLNIAEQLQILHCHNISLLLLSKDTINIVDSSKVLFVDWTFATNINQLSHIIPYVNTFYQELGHKLESMHNPAVCLDIFNLGKVFQFVLEEKQDVVPAKIKETLVLMLAANSNILLKDVVKVLDDCIANLRQDGSLTNLSRSRGKNEETRQQNVTTNRGFKLRVKHSVSAEENLSTFRSRDKSRQLSNNEQVIDLPSYNYMTKEHSSSKARLSTANYSKQPNRIKSTSPLAKHMDSQSVKMKNEIYQKGIFINKMRNLSYFLLNLHEFIFNKDQYPELSYMLLKKAFFCAKQALYKSKTLFIDSQKIFQSKLITIMTVQTQRISNLLLFQKELCKVKSNQPAFTRQLDYERVTDDEYFNKKIKYFAKEQLQRCEIWNPKQINKNLDNLFQTYLLVKKIEYHSYQKFWQEIYKPNIAHLSNQPYFSNQKRLGFRYIREKLVKIIQK